MVKAFKVTVAGATMAMAALSLTAPAQAGNGSAVGAGLAGFGIGAILGGALAPREVYVVPPPPPPPVYYGPVVRAAAMDTRLVRLLRAALSRLQPANRVFRGSGWPTLFLPLTVDRSMQSVRPSETRSLNHPALDHRGSQVTREDIEGPSNEHFEATDLSPIAEKFRLRRDTLLGISCQKGRPADFADLEERIIREGGEPCRTELS